MATEYKSVSVAKPTYEVLMRQADEYAKKIGVKVSLNDWLQVLADRHDRLMEIDPEAKP